MAKFKNEKELQEELANRLRSRRESIRLEVPVGEKNWRIDILTEREIIECKPKLNRSSCFQATSQLELYQKFYPDRRLIVAAAEIDQSARDILKAKEITFWPVKPGSRKVYSDKSSNAHKILADNQNTVVQSESRDSDRKHTNKPKFVKSIRPMWPYAAAMILGAIVFGFELLRHSQVSEITCFSTETGPYVSTSIEPGTYVKVLEESHYGRSKVALPNGSQCWVTSERISNP